VSTGFDGYSDEQWKAIVDARKDWPSGINWAEIRSEIERAGRGFWSARELRRGYLPDELQRIRRVIKDMKKLESDLSHFDIPIVKSMIMNRARHIEVELKSLRRDLERLDAILDGSIAFRGQADAHREILYFLMLRLWTGKLGGELKFSRDPKGKAAGGPLVRFLTAVLEPILGPEAPGSEGIAAIIKKERKHPAHFQQVIARAAASWDQRYRD
jgi:hypothetical protein